VAIPNDEIHWLADAIELYVTAAVPIRAPVNFEAELGLSASVNGETRHLAGEAIYANCLSG